MDIFQESKYDAVDGKIVNRATNEPIPDDEPIFIIRGKDYFARAVLGYYSDLVTDENHREAVKKRLDQFVEFANKNPDRMKDPDTESVKSDE